MSGPRPWSDVERELLIRKDVHAGTLPSNRALPNNETPESLTPGWTCQQPWEHRRYPVQWHYCAICWKQVGPNDVPEHRHALGTGARDGGSQGHGGSAD